MQMKDHKNLSAHKFYPSRMSYYHGRQTVTGGYF